MRWARSRISTSRARWPPTRCRRRSTSISSPTRSSLPRGRDRAGRTSMRASRRRGGAIATASSTGARRRRSTAAMSGMCRRALDVEAMIDAASVLIGHHDFNSFRSTACQAPSSIKTLDLLRVDARRRRDPHRCRRAVVPAQPGAHPGRNAAARRSRPMDPGATSRRRWRPATAPAPGRRRRRRASA